MTVKELKNFVNNISEEYDNKKIITDDKDYNEYCIGDSFCDIKNLDGYIINELYYLRFETK